MHFKNKHYKSFYFLLAVLLFKINIDRFRDTCYGNTWEGNRHQKSAPPYHMILTIDNFRFSGMVLDGVSRKTKVNKLMCYVWEIKICLIIWFLMLFASKIFCLHFTKIISACHSATIIILSSFIIVRPWSMNVPVLIGIPTWWKKLRKI